MSDTSGRDPRWAASNPEEPSPVPLHAPPVSLPAPPPEVSSPAVPPPPVLPGHDASPHGIAPPPPFQPPYGAPPSSGTPPPPPPPYGGQPQYGAQPPYGGPPGYGSVPPPPNNTGWYGPPPGPYGGAPVPPSARHRTAGRVVLGILLAVALLLGVFGVVLVFAAGDSPSNVVSSRGGSADGGFNDSLRRDAPDSEIELIGANGRPVDAVIAAAIADLETYWGEQFPEVFGDEYEPITGGFYSWSPSEALPACAETADDIGGNAYYCGYQDEVAWDDTTFMPYLLDTYGDLAVAVVMAHEWGHAIQARVGYEAETVTFEQQADCYAGAWVAHAMDGGSEFFEPDGRSMDFALAGFLELGDIAGSSALDPMAHGSAFDRINSFQQGFEDGNAACADYTDDTVLPRIVQIPFLTVDDVESGGNAPYADIFAMIDADLNDYWSGIAPEQLGEDWVALAAGTPFDSVIGATCGDDKVRDSAVFYCGAERSVFY
ncbi:MAG: hypothetical protein GX868_18570, partial [Actinobacteria bacterium]|nr:hypothetical protein [Actinomycetota bacterium]